MTRRFVCRGLAAALILAAHLPAPAAQKPSGKGESLVYIGTYTGEKSKGIYVYQFSSQTGEFTPMGLAAETERPSFLAIHPNRQFLYAVNEIGNWKGEKTGSVSAFRIDPQSGKLTLLNQAATGGGAPCHLVVDKTGTNLLLANYSGGNVATFALKPDGSLGERRTLLQHTGSSVTPRQKAPLAHSINLSADNRFAVAADLGTDEVYVYKFNPEDGSLTPNSSIKMKPASGPRHFAFHPSQRFGYVINEMISTVTAMQYDAKAGKFTEIHTITTLPEGFSGNNSTAEVQVHPSGRFLYGSNRGHDSIAIFRIDEKKGSLTSVDRVSTQGKTPRNFGIDPSGNFLIAANQGTDNLVVYRIDQKTGKLTPTGKTGETGSPVCVKFLPLQ
jgi:6-phosphogluconolactonase